MTLKDFMGGLALSGLMFYSFHHFDTTARTDERTIVTIEKEKIITRYKTLVVEKEVVIEQKQKEVNYVAKQRDEARAEVARLKSESDSALGRLREQMAASQAAAQGDAERTQRLITTQGRILAECGQEAINLAKRAEQLADENRDLRARLDYLRK